MTLRIRIDLPEDEWPNAFFHTLGFLAEVALLTVVFIVLVGGGLLVFG